MITPDLLAKYDVPAPRYTSYPTALSFHEMGEPPPPRPSDAGRPVALYFHIPYCRKLCWYCACTKVITRDESRTAEVVRRLVEELDQRSPWLDGREVVQIHLGGGTPTFLQPHELVALIEHVRRRLPLAPEAELSIEIDPRELSDPQVDAVASAGFNRASLGVQDHDPAVQKAIHRIQPRKMTRSAVDRLRDRGIDSINFDLVYGLPLQSEQSFQNTVRDVITMRPDRLAVYSYAHVPAVAPAQRILERRYTIPDARAKIAMFFAAAHELGGAGYSHIGMDHFALPDDSLSLAVESGTMRRNFMGYTTHRGVDIHAFGMSGISQTEHAYFQNERDLEPWEQAVDAGRSAVARGVLLTDDDRLRREIIMGIMCSHRVSLTDLAQRFEFDPRSDFKAQWQTLESFVDDGLVDVTDDTVAVTPLGRFFVRNIAATFDAYRNDVSGFSRAI